MLCGCHCFPCLGGIVRLHAALFLRLLVCACLCLLSLCGLVAPVCVLAVFVLVFLFFTRVLAVFVFAALS